MATMKLTWNEFFEVRESEKVADELIDVDDHGTATYNLVIKRDGRFWGANYDVDGEWGVVRDFIDAVEFVEVRPVEMTVVVYEPVDG